MKFIYGSVNEYQNTKGWISGAFFPQNLVNFDKNVEVNVKYYKGSASFREHYHTVKKTWTIVLSGVMRMKIDGKMLEIKSGEFIIYEPGVTEELIGTDPDTVVVSIHSPSGIVDKIEP